MTDLKAAVKEWREARQAIFDATADPKSATYHGLWDRLANAEYTLMKMAGRIE